MRAVVALPSLAPWGTELQTLTLVRVLRDAGWEVGVCAYFDCDPQVEAWYREAGATVTALGMRRTDGHLRLVKRLREHFAAGRPEVVHAQYLAPGVAPIVAARLAGVPAVLATVHYPGTGVRRRERTILTGAARLCTSFIAVSLAVERSWFGEAALFDPREDPARRHFTVYNAVDTRAVACAVGEADRAAVRNQLRLGEGERCIVYLGRVRREKGPDLALRALALLAGDSPRVRLAVIGDGSGLEESRALAARLGVGDRVSFLGRRPREEAWRLLGGCEMLIAPSRLEGFGLAAAEGQAAGLPVVAADVDGLREVVADGETGLLVAPGDPVAIAAGVRSLLADPGRARQLGSAGARRAAALFSVGCYREATLEIYRLALSRVGGVR